MRKTILIIAALAAVALGAASQVSAGRPTVLDIDESVPDATCPGVDLTFRLQGTMVIIRKSATEEIWAAPNFVISWSANGRILSSRGPAPLIITYNPDGSIAQTKVPGLLVAVTLPGSGVIFLETGLTVFDGPFPIGPISVSHGPTGFRSAEDYELFCSYFD